MLYRERGYAHSVAVITLTRAAPPHNSRPFHIGRYVVSVVMTALKLARLGGFGTVSASCAPGFSADSTNHASGARKATAMAASTTLTAAADAARRGEVTARAISYLRSQQADVEDREQPAHTQQNERDRRAEADLGELEGLLVHEQRQGLALGARPTAGHDEDQREHGQRLQGDEHQVG